MIIRRHRPRRPARRSILAGLVVFTMLRVVPAVWSQCPGAGDCFEPNGTPGCEQRACCTKVCAADPFCCQSEWDQVCATAAARICVDAPACPGEGTCFRPNGSPGCDDPACCELICVRTPACCDALWDAACADAAGEQCDSGGGSCPGTGGCFRANATPGCDTPECCERVCAEDRYCCDQQWDQPCADAAIDLCDGGDACPEDLTGDGLVAVDDLVAVLLDWECGLGPLCPGEGACFQSNGTPGCDEEACCTTVCEVDPFCCRMAWDQQCADMALKLCVVGLQVGCAGDVNADGITNVEDLVAVLLAWGPCEGVEAPCPGDGPCCEPGDSPGCDDLACCAAVCSEDPSCCESEWDSGCVALAGEACRICDVAGSDCCVANPTPGCDDPFCENQVCAEDRFCCDGLWDQLCANKALKICQACDPNGDPAPCPGEGPCCEINGTPGCDDRRCCVTICLADPFCCLSQWDQVCADAAATACAGCAP